MKHRPRILFCIAALLALTATAWATTLSGLEVKTADEGAEQLVIEASAPVTPLKTFLLANPDRLVVDLPKTTGALKLPGDYHGRLLKSARFAQFNPTTSRLVFDLAVPVTVKSVTPGAPLVIALAPAGLLPAEDVPVQAKEQKSPPVAAAAKSKPEPEDEKPLIAIDAGHGGQDPGAIGVHETHERDVTLNFALALRKALLRTGRYRVALTRDNDTFIMLHDRVDIARKAHADLLISMHADSNPNPEARGLSIYTLSATASDDEAAALAERENKADVISGIDLRGTDQDVANILIDLTQRETMNKSTTLADDIVESLHPKIQRLPSTHRFAGFRVLKAPDVPSVLIELGFLSNPVDERLLLSPEYRDLVVGSVIKGIDRYYAEQ